MKQTMPQLPKGFPTKERLATLRLEMDYELAVLFEAMEASDDVQMRLSKDKLRALREQWLQTRA
ncbi:hypothetical protein [Bacillus fonticola]|uniref:hypothetical protein n=1 Tax=Bacillus fonticola TaxID=2728853 RepID=UPI001D139D41|nr:hypothetical protein [Bacillus fonticola]